MSRLSFYPVGESYLLVAVAALVLLGLLAIGPARSKTSRGRRIVLALLRLSVIAMVVLAMLRPTWVTTEMKKQSATIVVLADQSRSMSVPDGPDGATRYDVVRRALADSEKELRTLGEDFEVKAYGFDAEVHPAEVARGKIHLPDAPQGQATALGAALDDVLRLEAGKRLLGVILLSDGAQRCYAPRDTPPQTPANRMKYLGFPLFCIPVGQARLGKDVAVKELLVNQQVFVKNELEVAGDIRIDGYVNQQIPVRLIVEATPGKPVVADEQTVAASSDAQSVPFRFHYVPQTPGEYKITVEAAQQPGERVLTNNQMSTFVKVLKGGLRVLYCEGERRWEQKYIRRALDASPDIKLDFLHIDAANPQTRPPDLAARFQPGKYDAYILGDIDSQAFSAEQLADLTKTVSQGAGLIMLGGFHTFGPGGYGNTALRPVLPVKMEANERQTPGPIRSDVQIPGPLRMRPTDLGQRHFAMLLARTPAESAAIWDRLPPLEGANRFSDMAPGAVVLAAAGGEPLLVAHSFGNGRVMAFAGDSTWRWWMRGFETADKRFWRQIVLWLARRDQLTEGSVWIKIPQRRLAPGQRAEFTVGAQSPHAEPLDDLTGGAEVELPDGSRRPVSLIRQENTLCGSFRDTQTAGDYTLQVSVKHLGQAVGTARARFMVYAQDLELDNAAADTELMASLAAMTLGQRLAPEQLPELLRRLAKATNSLLVEHETKKTFWDSWPFFLLLVAILGVEWYLRKRWGLV